jgi:hypothetical protein
VATALEAQIQRWLLGASAITGIVGDRVTTRRRIQGDTFPSIVHEMISRGGSDSMAGTIRIVRSRWSVRCEAYTEAQLYPLRVAVDERMRAFRSEGAYANPTVFALMVSMVDPYGSPQVLIRTLDYFVWHAIDE